MTLTFDPTFVPTDAWQTLLSVEDVWDVYSIKTALYTDTVFSAWAEANPSESLAAQYSDNAFAMLCSITVTGGFDYIANETDLDGIYCLVGEKVAWGGAFIGGSFSPIIKILGADTTEPVLGEYLGNVETAGNFGFDILDVS